MTAARIDERDEWLEADGLGGFASGTVTGVRTRRYHALLLTATTPPTGRFALVNGFDAWVETDAGRFALTTQRYAPDVLHPDGADRILAFRSEPWPAWRYRLEDGAEILFELFAKHAAGTIVMRWRLDPGRMEVEGDNAPGHARLVVRPLLSGRDIHATHHENDAFRFDADVGTGTVGWTPYDGLPGILASHNGDYSHDPVWYRNFLYTVERDRGLDCTEDLASPGLLTWDLRAGDALLLLSATTSPDPIDGPAMPSFRRAHAGERMRRGRFPSPLHRAADAYIVRRGDGRTIIAGYPWFADWGRDTFIALRGLCIAGDRLLDARRILLQWAGAVSGGMLPNRFVEHGGDPEFNSVDASLWFIVAVGDFLEAASGRRRICTAEHRARLEQAVLTILDGYSAGTRHGVRADRDGLLACGEPGVQLTWMDARYDGVVVTPRIGKPVEVNALWINALAIGARMDPALHGRLELARRAFPGRFWNGAAGCLFDVVDVDDVSGEVDDALRPNQIFAVGGLPLSLLDAERARSIVDRVEHELLTPLGLRTLAPGSPAYQPRYEGGVADRDRAYHQGTVWPWLIGAFVDAWLRTHTGPGASEEAARRFLTPLIEHLGTAGLGHVSEIADAEPPFTPRGCPFQAWSVAEFLRIRRTLTGV